MFCPIVGAELNSRKVYNEGNCSPIGEGPRRLPRIGLSVSIVTVIECKC